MVVVTRVAFTGDLTTIAPRFTCALTFACDLALTGDLAFTGDSSVASDLTVARFFAPLTTRLSAISVR
ncbi:MAG: hypothetical protein RL701_1178 [Pseudomonadota bacterium]|jgi:hypothetical protein